MSDSNKEIIDRIDCFLLDMDGTIYLGEQWIDGAKDFLKRIEETGRKYCFLTNNSSKSPEIYIEKLKRMGLSIGKEKIVTSGQATIHYLKREFSGKSVFLLGNELLKKEFTDAGIDLEEGNPQVVVVGFDTSLDYKKMCKVCDLVRTGLPYISTHPDYNCPTETGFIPDAGAIHAFIKASAFRDPDYIIGKPNGEIIDFALEFCHADRNRTAMVGDRLYTDIEAGNRSGLTSILVYSGETTKEDLKNSTTIPGLAMESVNEITPLL